MAPTGGTSSSLQCPVFDDKNYSEHDTDSCPLHYTTRPKKRETYPRDCVRKIQIVYIIAAIVWIIIIFALCYWELDIIGGIILAFPLVIFGINFHNADNITHEVESEMFTGNFISFGFLIAIILINWSKIENKGKYFTILFISLVLIMLSLVDVWVDPVNISIAKHLRSIFQTTALALLVYALYVYYKDVMRTPFSDTSKNAKTTYF